MWYKLAPLLKHEASNQKTRNYHIVCVNYVGERNLLITDSSGEGQTVREEYWPQWQWDSVDMLKESDGMWLWRVEKTVLRKMTEKWYNEAWTDIERIRIWGIHVNNQDCQDLYCVGSFKLQPVLREKNLRIFYIDKSVVREIFSMFLWCKNVSLVAVYHVHIHRESKGLFSSEGIHAVLNWCVLYMLIMTCEYIWFFFFFSPSFEHGGDTYMVHIEFVPCKLLQDASNDVIHLSESIEGIYYINQNHFLNSKTW